MRGRLSLPRHIELLVAASAAEGPALAQQAQPQLVLLDLGLPDKSGLDLLQRFKAESRLAQWPVIVVCEDAIPLTHQ